MTITSGLGFFTFLGDLAYCVACGLKFHWYLMILSLKFQKARTKIEVENFNFDHKHSEILSLKSSNTNETLGHTPVHCNLKFGETPTVNTYYDFMSFGDFSTVPNLLKQQTPFIRA